MRRKVIGNYLERPVEAIATTLEENISLGMLISCSVVCVIVDRGILAGSAFNNWLLRLLSQAPLAVAFGGTGSRAAFERALGVLSHPSKQPHTMTRLIEEEGESDVIADFLRATWPSDDRFDEWTTYIVLNPSGEDTLPQLEQGAARALKGEGL